ncbi:MAG: UDP-N-acetylmuramate--L-alanine ligase [Rickettsiales bacterium]|nr:UDP-N-acetylmuramate--L-alanine ligase [Rickettsiales bacterium]
MNVNLTNFSAKNFGVIHFCGIGGIGMSGIAEILANMGCDVQGSDISENNNIARLKSLNVKIFIGQAEENIMGASVVIRSSAIRDDNIEVVEARKNNIPVIARADMLKEIMRLKNSVTIAGTHGKTTTTSMIAELFESAGLEPTVINGGILNSCNTNAYLGSGDWIVAEADESDGSFNKLPAEVAVVTNIDPEHIEFYGNFENLRKAFLNFVEKVPFYGFAVLCNDHMIVKNIISEIKDRRIISYGFADDSMVRGVNLRPHNEGYLFDVAIKLKDVNNYIRDIYLPMYGKHNVQNALAAISVGVGFGVSEKILKLFLENFLGVKRRLTKVETGLDIMIIDDYGHHPTEIRASISAVNDIKKENLDGELIVIVQPHRYSRVYNLFSEFSNAFVDADKVFVTDIYAAGEDEIPGINKESLALEIEKNSDVKVFQISNLNNLDLYLKGHIKKKDILLFLGAGDITRYANELPGKLKKII